MYDSDRIITNENLLKQVETLTNQVNALTAQHEADLVTIKAWKTVAQNKVNEFETRISALENP